MVSLAERMIKNKDGYKNAILVDYSLLCCNYFVMSKTVVPKMGVFIANKIRTLKLDPSSVDIVAHSLGVQVASYAGNSLINGKHNKLNRIFGKLTIK